MMFSKKKSIEQLSYHQNLRQRKETRNGGHTIITMSKAKKKSSRKKNPAATSKAVAVRKEPRSLAKRPAPSGLARWDINIPDSVIQFGKILRDYIVKNKLSVTIKTKSGTEQFAMVSAWQFAGNSFGLIAIPRRPVQKHEKGEYVTTLYITKELPTKDKKSTYKKEVPIFIGFASDIPIIEQVKKSHVITKEMTRPYFAYECECDVRRMSDQSIVSYGLSSCSNMEEEKVDLHENAVSSTAQTRSIGKAYRNLIGFVMKSAGYSPTPAEEMNGVNTHEAQVIQDDDHEQLPFPGEDKFKQICASMLSKKEVTIKVIKEHWQLTEDQEKALEVIEKNRKK